MNEAPQREDGVQPLFLLSLPRSGSTLLQRMVSNTPKIATTAEPWILLPLIDRFLVEGGDVYGAYDHETARVANLEFFERLDMGRSELEEAIADFVVNMYDAAANDEAVYFLDKTPRYAVYLPQLLALFPDARYIVLTRDLRSVIASIIRTWGRGRWNVFLYLDDLVAGVDHLVGLADDPPSNVLVIDYDDVLADPSAVAARLTEHLGVEIDGSLLPADDPSLLGSMGDRASAGRSDARVTSQTSSWDVAFTGLLRRWWLRRYLREHEVLPSRGAETVALVPRPFRLFDHWSDLVLVPLTLVWPRLNRASGYRLESVVRRRLSSVVREHYAARPPAVGQLAHARRLPSWARPASRYAGLRPSTGRSPDLPQRRRPSAS